MTEFDSNWFRRFRRNLRNWYEHNARHLPWRKTSNAYRIWISEIMLQQTTVVAVVPFYQRFLKRFPTLGKLAEAPEDEVLRMWEGLGYYSRARNIHKTANILAEQYQGRIPDDVTELRKLPGIGRYTAGAIASFAYERPAAIVEANTLRLYSRLMGLEQHPRSREGQRLLWNFAEQVLPRKSPGRFNQALIELGAMLCTPSEPECTHCPVKSCCRAFAEGTQHEIPRPVERPKITRITEAAVVVRQNNRFLLRHCKAGERWAGLWDFPRFPLESGIGSRSQGKSPRKIPAGLKPKLESHLWESLGIRAEVSELLTELTHSVTRYRIRLFCFLALVDSALPVPNPDHRWIRPADFENYPLSATGRKIANLLKELDI